MLCQINANGSFQAKQPHETQLSTIQSAKIEWAIPNMDFTAGTETLIAELVFIWKNTEQKQ